MAIEPSVGRGESPVIYEGVNSFLPVARKSSQPDLYSWEQSDGLVLRGRNAVSGVIVPVRPKNREVAMLMREVFKGCYKSWIVTADFLPLLGSKTSGATLG